MTADTWTDEQIEREVKAVCAAHRTSPGTEISRARLVDALEKVQLGPFGLHDALWKTDPRGWDFFVSVAAKDRAHRRGWTLYVLKGDGWGWHLTPKGRAVLAYLQGEAGE